MNASTSSTFPKPQQIATNGVELSVHIAGKPGRPILLCHGWPELAYSWRYQIEPLVEAGYHVIAPNQRGYAGSSQPAEVTAYDMTQLTGDLCGLLDHFGYDKALFAGHDWGAIVTWGLTQLHPERMSGLINLSVPYLQRGSDPWVEFWHRMLGDDFYIVHFNRQPNVAARAFEANTEQFLRNMYRTDQWLEDETGMSGMTIVQTATDTNPPGKLCMSEKELAVFVAGFEQSGFEYPICWYRNFDRNWKLLGEVDEAVREKVKIPVLMIHGSHDMVPANPELAKVAENLEVHTLDCGHWIMQERPEATTRLMLDWLQRQQSTN